MAWVSHRGPPQRAGEDRETSWWAVGRAPTIEAVTSYPPPSARTVALPPRPPQPPVRVRHHNVLPVVVTVVGVFIAFGVVSLIRAGHPRAFLVGTIPSTVALVVCLWVYHWIDRWEPEPRSLVVMSLVWGGSIAVVFAMLVEAFLGAGHDQAFIATFIAPPVEEFAKASVFFVLFTGARKQEVTSLTDHLVYVGVCALGFAYVENLGYFATAEDTSALVVMTLVRTGFGVFGHPLYASATAIGLWAWRSGRRGGFLLLVLGYAAACLLHGVWNGASSYLGSGPDGSLVTMVVVYVLFFVPVFLGMARLVVVNRRREAHAVRRQLPLMVSAGLLTPVEADMVLDQHHRRMVLSQAPSRKARQFAMRLISAVTEAALTQDRVERGEGGPEVVRRRDLLASWLRTRPVRIGR